MSEKTNEYENQAKQLREVFNELQQHASESEAMSNEYGTKEDNETPKIDVLNLPPRKEVHDHHSRARLSVSRPLIRFLTVIILMIIVIVGAYIIGGEDLLNIIEHLK